MHIQRLDPAVQPGELLSREGFRMRREGFPEVSAQDFDIKFWQIKHDQLVAMSSGQTSIWPGAVQNRIVKTEEFLKFAALALEHVRELANLLNGNRPTFYQVVASVSRDPQIGDVGSAALEKTVRILHSRWFHGEDGKPALWVGNDKNLYDALTVKLPPGQGAYGGLSIAAALLQFVKDNPAELVTSTAAFHALNLGVQSRRTGALLSPAFQLLAQLGHIVRHPDHLQEENGSSNMVSVWSDNSGSWRKPAILNPELAVLVHALHDEGGWLFQLYSDTDGDRRSIFSHHTIIKAANRLAERGLIELSQKHMENSYYRPSGDRPYAHVCLTENAIAAVRSWHSVSEGELMTRESYETLRVNLVERIPLASSSQEQYFEPRLTSQEQADETNFLTSSVAEGAKRPEIADVKFQF